MSLTDVGCKGKIIGKGNRCQLPKAKEFNKAKGLSALVCREFLASSGAFTTAAPPRRAEAALYPNYTVMFMGLSRKGGLKLMNPVQPIWLDDTIKVACPNCQQAFELEAGTIEWFKARRRQHLQSLDNMAMEGSVAAVKMALEIDGIYQQKTVNVNLSAGFQLNATVNAELATIEAVRILGIIFGITQHQYGKILKMLKEGATPKKHPPEFLRRGDPQELRRKPEVIDYTEPIMGEQLDRASMLRDAMEEETLEDERAYNGQESQRPGPKTLPTQG